MYEFNKSIITVLTKTFTSLYNIGVTEVSLDRRTKDFHIYYRQIENAPSWRVYQSLING